MSKWVTLDFLCEVPWCRQALLKELVERPTDGSELNSVVLTCSECGGTMRTAFLSSPGITNATHVDGAFRPGFKELKSAAELEVKMYQTRPALRGEMQVEIDRLRSTKK